MHKPSQAFTLIEVLIVIAIFGFMANMITSRLGRRPPSSEWPTVLDTVNSLIFFARQEAISTQKIHRIAFFRKGKEVSMSVEVQKPDLEHPEKEIFEPATCPYFSVTQKVSECITIDTISHGKYDEWAERNGKAYCHVIADGLVQETIIRLTRSYKGNESKVTFTMMPFLGKFEMTSDLAKSRK